MKANESILVISDLHAPYFHPDTIAFLRKVKAEIRPDKVVLIGDEIDLHSLSFHPKDADLAAAGDEFKSAIQKLKPIYDLFPEANIVDSNHGSLVYRKALYHGLPRRVFKSYREMIEAPAGWHWSFDLTIKLPNGSSVYLHHGKTAGYAKLSKNMSMNCVQGHFHSRFEIIYWANPQGLFWDMRVGCLIDDRQLSFAYNKNTMDRPIIGVGAIIDGHPRLLPMVLNKSGRWIGEIR